MIKSPYVERATVSTSIYRVHHLDAKYIVKLDEYELRDIERIISQEYNKSEQNFDIKFNKDEYGFIYIKASTHSACIEAFYKIRSWIVPFGDITID